MAQSNWSSAATAGGSIPGQVHTFNPAIGLTASQVQAQQLQVAQNLGMNVSQKTQPGDPNPDLYYWVRERDDTWTQRDRRTIDSGQLGDIRWYTQGPGLYYAERLAMD